MNRFLLASIFFLLVSFPAHTEDRIPLSRQTIESFLSASNELVQLAQAHPNIGNFAEHLNLSDQDKALQLLKKSPVYPEIDKIAKTNGFSDISQILDLSQRVMGSLYFLQLQDTSHGINLIEMVKVLQNNIERLKNDDADPATIEKMEKQLAYHKARADRISTMLSILDQADKDFASQNSQWLLSKFKQ